jgi:hypothetical protein
MPTAAANTYTGAGIVPVYAKPEPARHHVKLGNSVSLAAGTVMGELTASPGTFKAYASGNADGSQNPKGILEFACATDGSGNITVGSTTAGAQGFTTTAKSCPVFFRGCFSTAELTGLDATALTNSPSWNLKNGTVSSGVVELP